MIETPLIVGFVGYPGAGKDYCSDYLQQKHDYIKRGFSDPLYEQLAVLNPLIYHPVLDKLMTYNTIVDLYGVDAAKRNCPEIRSWLQKLGEECGRQIFGRDCWLRAMDLRIEPTERTAIRDVRYTNEIDFIRARGGIIVYVKNSHAFSRDTWHASEQLDFNQVADYVIINMMTDATYVHRRLEEVIQNWRNDGSTH